MNLENFAEILKIGLMENFGNHIRFWVWPAYDGVNGFYGDGRVNNAVIIWITERPSSARDKRKEHKFPDWIDKSFYRLLKEEGFENMHFTDFVKIMDDAGKQPTEKELKISAEWMKKEIKMLEGDGKRLIIIANSKNVKKWMEEYLPEYPCNRYNFFKYSLRYGKEQRLREELKELAKRTI